jgi:hypothetical protein
VSVVTFVRAVETASACIRVVMPDAAGGTGPDDAEVAVRLAYPARGPVLDHRWPVQADALEALRGALGLLVRRVEAQNPAYRLWVHTMGHRPLVWRWPEEPEPGGLRIVRSQLERLARLQLVRAMAECRRGFILAERIEDAPASAQALRAALGALAEFRCVRGNGGGRTADSVDLDDRTQTALRLVAHIVADRIDGQLEALGLRELARDWRG